MVYQSDSDFLPTLFGLTVNDEQTVSDNFAKLSSVRQFAKLPYDSIERN